MNLTVVGSGYVGLVTGACFAEIGENVICVDKDASKVDTLNAGVAPIFEKKLPELLVRNTQNGRLKFTTDIKSAVQSSNIVFICVNTPSHEEAGHADLSDVFQVTREVGTAINNYTVVVTKSTVPVGTGRKVHEILKSVNPDGDFDVVSNPEFLSEGSAVEDFMHPSRVIVGTESERARRVIEAIYLPISLTGVPILVSNLETAELIKYAANAFLATKITFINEIADLCEKAGVDVRDLSYGIGLDERIGRLYLNPSPGYGGLCFPKDTLALIHTAKNLGSPVKIIETVAEINEQRKIRMAHRIMRLFEGSVKGKTIAVLGLTFKPNTDDLRDSPSVAIIRELLKEGACIKVHDPKGIDNARKELNSVEFCSSSYDAIEGTDALVIATAWEEYGVLDLKRIKKIMNCPVLVDFHNLYEGREVQKLGFTYQGVGQGNIL